MAFPRGLLPVAFARSGGDTAHLAQRNLDIVERGYEAFTRGDLEAAFAVFAPDIEAYDDPRVVGEHVYRGRDGFLRMLAVTTEGFEDVQYIADEFEEAGDHVLVKARRSGRGAKSGVTVEERQYHVWELRDGQAVRFHMFLSHSDARRAAGLDT